MKLASEWSYPEPRAGLAGQWDRFVGPGATVSEQVLPVVVAILASVLVTAAAVSKDLGWTAAQYILAAVLAFDLFGGPATLATPSAKRWYHRPAASHASHLRFVSAHLLQIGLVAWLFRGGDWPWTAAIGAAVFLASAIVLATPLHLRRAVAYALACAGAALGLSVFESTPGLQWFVPVLFIKLVIAHSTIEEPYVRSGAPRP